MFTQLLPMAVSENNRVFAFLSMGNPGKTNRLGRSHWFIGIDQRTKRFIQNADFSEPEAQFTILGSISIILLTGSE